MMAASAFAGGDRLITIDLGSGVTVQASGDVAQVPEQGIDSIVGSFGGNGFTCRYDHGLYSNDLSSIESAVVQQVDLKGVPARLVSADPDFDGLHVPEIAKTVIGARRLTVTCHSNNEKTRQRVRAILTSLEIAPAD